jgi:hypothetical protein
VGEKWLELEGMNRCVDDPYTLNNGADVHPRFQLHTRIDVGVCLSNNVFGLSDLN